MFQRSIILSVGVFICPPGIITCPLLPDMVICGRKWVDDLKKYEKNLKKLIDISKNGCDPVHAPSNGFTEGDLRFLKAKNLIRMEPAGDDEFYAIIENRGISYFLDKAEARTEFIKNHFANFLTGFISGALATLAASEIVSKLLEILRQ